MVNTHRFTRGAWGASLVALAIATAQPASAQTFASLRGQGATPGATVTVTDTVTGQTATTTVTPDGTFAIVGLRPSTYTVKGAGPDQNVTLPVGQTVTIDASPEPAETGVEAPSGAASGDIVVRGRRDRTEVRSATVTTVVSQQQIENLPQNDRNFLNFANLAPGVQTSPSGQDKRIQSGAVSGDQVNVFIDGLSFKNPINHGGIAGQNFSPGNPFPQLAVQEFKVDTQNFKAEYEQAGSAIITAVTKTGGTKFHGDLFAQIQPKDWVARPYFDRPGNANNPGFFCPTDTPGVQTTCYREKPDYRRWQFGGDLSGPIISEKLHFFIAAEGTNQTSAGTTVNLNPALVPASIVSEFNGSYPADFRQRLYFGKLTAFATDRDTIDASAFIRKEENLRDFGGNATPEHGRNITSNGKLFQLDWRHRGDNWLNEMTLAYNTFENGTPRVSTGPEIELSAARFGDTTALLGGNSFQQDDNQKTYTFKNNVTFDRGEHIIKAGVKVSKSTLKRLEDSFGNGSYSFISSLYDGFDSTIPYRARISTAEVLPATAKNTQVGLFIQDDWTPNDHWTINVGLRWDYESDAKGEDFVTPDYIATALRNYPGWAAAGIDPEDYISDGDNRKPFKGAFQPRLGVSYDVNGDRDLIFFAGAGRYYDRPLFITAGIEAIKSYYQRVTAVNFCTVGGTDGTEDCATVAAANGGTLPVTYLQWSDSYRDVESLRAAALATGLRGDVWLLNNKTKHPYSDQFNIGVRKRFSDWQLSATLSHIRSNNIFKYVRGNRFSNGWYTRNLIRDGAGNVIGCTDGGTNWVVDNFPDVDYPACPATQGDLAGFNGKLNIGDNSGKARYTALFLQADKAYTKASGWGVTTTLTIQRARTNVGTELTGDEFFAGPDQTQFGWQRSQGVPKWNFVATGIADIPFGMTLSGTFIANSGPAFGTILAPWNASVSPPDNACCIANLGGVYFPEKNIAYKTLDLRVAKTFKVWGGHEVTADLQVFNVFDWVNRNYSAWGAGAGDNPTLKENGTVGNARSFQAGLKYSF